MIAQKLKIIAGPAGHVKFDEKFKIDNSIRKHPQSFQSNTHLLGEDLINLGLIRSFFLSISNMLHDSSKTENYCRSSRTCEI